MKVEYVKATASDYEEVVAIADKAFGHSPEENFFKKLQPKLYKNDDTMGCHTLVKEDGKIAGLMCVYNADIEIFGTTLKTGGVGTVCVLPEYRGRGYMKELMHLAQKQMEDDKVDLAILGGIRRRYEYFGYTVAGINLSALFRKIDAGYMYGKDAYFGYEFSDIAEDDKDTLDKLYELYMRKPVKVLRPRHKFFDNLCGNGARPVAITKKGELCGYIYLNYGDMGAGEIELYDFSELGHVLNDLMVCYKTESITIGFVECFNKEKSDFLINNGGLYDIHSINKFAVLNFPRVLQAYLNVKAASKGLVDGEFTFEVEGHKPFRIKVENGIASVEEIECEAEIKLPYLLAVQKFFAHGSSNYNLGVKLPAVAESWFPAPLWIAPPDLL